MGVQGAPTAAAMDARHPQPRTAGHRPPFFAKMEALVREMQDPETGVPIRSQKLFLTSIPSAFMGYDLIEWLMERLEIEDSAAEAIHLANLLCQYGYFFPVGESRNLIVKDDSSLYRFQTPYYWPSQNHSADTTDYAIYLTKRLSRNKQKHGLEDYEVEAYNRLKKALAHKWDFITMQAEEQVKLAKDRKKGDKIVTDSQERAYWRVYRPPPGFTNCLETAPVPDKTNTANRARKKTAEDLKREIEFLNRAVSRTRLKASQAAEGLLSIAETYWEYDPLLTPPQPSNPWITDDPTNWILNEPKVEVPTEKRVRQWGLAMEKLVNDPTGLHEFTNYLRKEYSHENIRFWQAVNELRSGPTSNVNQKVKHIYEEFLKPGAPCEINIDGKTMELTQMHMRHPTRYTYDLAAEHVYVLLLKKDCYPRFLRSEHYKTLLANAIQPLQKKRFFSFGGPGKKKISTTSAPNNIALTQTPQPLKRHGSDDQGSTAGLGALVCPGDSGLPGTHAGSTILESRLDSADAPYSSGGDRPGLQGTEVCPWDNEAPRAPAAGAVADNICPWESSDAPAALPTVRVVPGAGPATMGHRSTLTAQTKPRPDRSKSMDIPHSTTKRVSGMGGMLAPIAGEPSLPEASSNVCPWEAQELPQRQEKSKSVDVDVCPWETHSSKKISTSSAPGAVVASEVCVSKAVGAGGGGGGPGPPAPAATPAEGGSSEKKSGVAESGAGKGAVVAVGGGAQGGSVSSGAGGEGRYRKRGDSSSSTKSQGSEQPHRGGSPSVKSSEGPTLQTPSSSWAIVPAHIVPAQTIPVDTRDFYYTPDGKRKSITLVSPSSLQNTTSKATKEKANVSSKSQEKPRSVALSPGVASPEVPAPATTTKDSTPALTPTAATTTNTTTSAATSQLQQSKKVSGNSEGPSSPSSSCSSSSYSESRRIKMDYTVRSGHVPSSQFTVGEEGVTFGNQYSVVVPPGFEGSAFAGPPVYLLDDPPSLVEDDEGSATLVTAGNLGANVSVTTTSGGTQTEQRATGVFCVSPTDQHRYSGGSERSLGLKRGSMKETLEGIEMSERLSAKKESTGVTSAPEELEGEKGGTLETDTTATTSTITTTIASTVSTITSFSTTVQQQQLPPYRQGSPFSSPGHEGVLPPPPREVEAPKVSDICPWEDDSLTPTWL